MTNAEIRRLLAELEQSNREIKALSEELTQCALGLADLAHAALTLAAGNASGSCDGSQGDTREA